MYVKDKQAAFKKEEDKLTALRATLEKESLTLTDAQKQEKQRSFQEKVQAFQKQAQDADRELRQKDTEFTNSAIDTIRKITAEVAKAEKVNMVLGGITSSMRNAIKDPIVARGKTLYIYPQLYEGKECTPYLFCTGPTPAQQCDEFIPWLIKNGGKKFALPSANYVWPHTLNVYARKVIESNGGEVVFAGAVRSGGPCPPAVPGVSVGAGAAVAGMLRRRHSSALASPCLAT